jgi:hypothetical protein
MRRKQCPVDGQSVQDLAGQIDNRLVTRGQASSPRRVALETGQEPSTTRVSDQGDCPDSSAGPTDEKGMPQDRAFDIIGVIKPIMP